MKNKIQISVFAGWGYPENGATPIVCGIVEAGDPLTWWSYEVAIPQDGKVTVIARLDGRELIQTHFLPPPKLGERLDYAISTEALI